MTIQYSLQPEINLHVESRVSSEDALRQRTTAEEILRRFAKLPGLILADEVGMGKTFVALAVAVSVALQNRGKRPVVVMVPSVLKEKWPGDFQFFRQKCLPPQIAKRLEYKIVENATDFLKLLDDPVRQRKSIIFMTHGAMSRGLNDRWVMLALIQRSMYRKRGIGRLKSALIRNVSDLMQMKTVGKLDESIWNKLLATPSNDWRRILEPLGLVDDDPVPEAVIKTLSQLPMDDVFKKVCSIPKLKTVTYQERIITARETIKKSLRKLWKDCLARTTLHLPLLILDEAHHLKNPSTNLASLFHSPDSKNDADEISGGALAGCFERMLFLTATPFQLGHSELCSVLDRFDGIRWKGRSVPSVSRSEFVQRRQELREALDAAQESAIALDKAWGRLQESDLTVDDQLFDDVESWWSEAQKSNKLSPVATAAQQCFKRVKRRMGEAEEKLRPWVIRHIKPRQLPGEFSTTPRRQRFPGGAILVKGSNGSENGLSVTGDSLLPFLLAARAASFDPNSRPVFAEGLASSYQAFLFTRRNIDREGIGVIDGDDDPLILNQIYRKNGVQWYLKQLQKMIPQDAHQQIAHPKVAATVQRAVEIWKSGEKCLVFCHFVETGRILRQTISDAIRSQMVEIGAKKLGIKTDRVLNQLYLIGDRFFDTDSPLRRACDEEANRLVSQFDILSNHKTDLIEIVRRNLRTPSFLVRFFPLERSKRDKASVRMAFEKCDSSNLSLRQLFERFFEFLVEHCDENDRQRYISALKRIQTGTHFGQDVTNQKEYDKDELQGTKAEALMPNVRLVNGTTKSETRQRLMLTFNTPFYPDVLIASQVMAEGVDLHLNCRHVIHHDLCWNPSTLEQRTGRIDRIGAKAEKAGCSIDVYLPYIGQTQDEKMYRVVMDRERWFNVVMGEDYKVDLRTTEQLAARIPFPLDAATDLAFNLAIPIWKSN